MASAKSILEKMIAAMNRGGDSAKRAILRAKDIDMFAKPTPKKARALKKSPIPLRAYVSSKSPKISLFILLRVLNGTSQPMAIEKNAFCTL
jgi:hypothetical protein